MDKELIKGLIAEYQQFVKSVSFVKRAVTLSDNFNYVFVGLRRVGKSYLMYQQIHHLIETGISPEEILFFNFEDERIAGMDTEHLDMIKRCYEEMYSHRPIFFLDEIQIVPHWEQFVRRLADQKYRVYDGSKHGIGHHEASLTAPLEPVGQDSEGICVAFEMRNIIPKLR
jgi:predicted AAA+ superfamily ATPase